MSALVQVRDLLVQRRGRVTLEIHSLDVEKGEILTLVGPNGAGKSTFLLTLAGLLPIERGSILYAELPISQWNALEYRRKISFVFQDPLLLDLSVIENVSLGLKFRCIPRGEINARVDHWLRMLAIDSLAKRRGRELSGGEARRVSLARALALDPELLLLDEPFSALDPPAHAKLLEDLGGLLARDHRTTIFVTHNLKEAARLGYRVAVMVGGKLRQVAPLQQIRAEPEDEEVRAFVHEHD